MRRLFDGMRVHDTVVQVAKQRPDAVLFPLGVAPQHARDQPAGLVVCDT
jgi:hypothetical protein